MESLSKASERLEQGGQALKYQWSSVHTALNKKRFQLLDVVANKHMAGQLASLLSVNNRWFWLFGLAAIASLVGLVFYDRRHELRRWLKGGRARNMRLSKVLMFVLIFLAAVTVSTFAMGDRLYRSLLQFTVPNTSSPLTEILEENRSTAESLAKLKQQWEELDDQYRQKLVEWRRNGGQSSSADAILFDQELRFRDLLRRLVRQYGEQQAVAQKLESDLAALSKVEQDLESNLSDWARYRSIRQTIQVGLGLSLLGLACGGGVFFRHTVRSRQEKNAITCPQCLAEGSLEPADDGSGKVRCNNEEECGFSCPEPYLDMVKLCFPTLGATVAGKTHWLAMAYSELKEGRAPPGVEFYSVETPASTEFDELVETVQGKHIQTGATQHDRIPFPLIFHFKDNDRWGESDVLLNLFDYSGEIFLHHNLASLQRRRALDADGYLFFLDPTRPSREQSNALHHFRQDLTSYRHLKPGKQLHTPVALCVSKIDLLVNQSYAASGSGGIVDQFYDDLGRIGWKSNLESMRRRSKLVKDLRSTIWPGWEIDKQVGDLFGGRHMYFPLTPVGLSELGETDLSKRNIQPFGLLDPLLWLLHMNGYPVFRDDR